MNRIQLRIQRARALEVEVVRVLIDGRDLVDLVRPIELQFAAGEGHPDIAGGYDGLLPRDWLDLPEQYGDDGRAAVLACECGEVGCWPLRARIEEDDVTVRWSGFQQPHRPDWSYESVGPFVFDRGQYYDEVGRVRDRARDAGV